jgi:hypothetical protein
MNNEPEVIEVVELVELGTASEATRAVLGGQGDSDLQPGYIQSDL